MKTILTLSPHLDDAAFSVGPLLAQWATELRVVVATVFTKSVAQPEKFALACQLDKGLPATADYMKIRRSEDLAWAEKIGVVVTHGPFAEAPHRGYHSVQELFGPILSTDAIGPSLLAWWQTLRASFAPDLVLAPLGLGGHVDHQWVRQVASAATFDPATLVYFQDQPYAAKAKDAVPGSFREKDELLVAWTVPLRADSRTRALQAVEAYPSQIPFQFGGAEQMKDLLGFAWGENISLFHREAASASIQALRQTTLS